MGIRMPAVARFVLVLLLSLALLPLNSAFAEAVCREHAFKGMLAHKARGDLALSGVQTTSDPRRAVVYIESDQDGILYYQSNFITPPGKDSDGAPFYPTKVKGSPSENPAFADAKQVFDNIIGEDIAFGNAVEVASAFANDVFFLIDISVIDNHGIPRVNLGNAKNIRTVHTHVPERFAVALRKISTDAQRDPSLRDAEPTTGPAELLKTLTPPPSLVAKIKGCCLYGRPPHEVGRFSEVLKRAKFDARRVKVAALVIDSETRDAILSSKRVDAARASVNPGSMRGPADMAALLESARGGTLILLGHVEGSDYLIRRSDGTEQFRMSIAEVRRMAREKHVSLVDIGCETAAAIQASSLGVAVVNRYRPAAAVRSLENVLASAKNHEDFLVGLSSEGLRIVIDETYFSNDVRTASATVYSRLASSLPQWVKVGTFGMTDAPAAWYTRVTRAVTDLWN